MTKKGAGLLRHLFLIDPRLRGDDEEGFRHVRVGEHPLEGCTRTSPEPALSLSNGRA